MDLETSTKCRVYILPRCPSCQNQANFVLPKYLFPMNIPGENLQERKRVCVGRVSLTLGESRCLTVGQSVKLLEQFSFPICLDTSYTKLTKTCIYQQTAEDNFQQHCAQSKRRHSKDLIKPLEPEWSTDFIVSHWLCLLHSPKHHSS